jgi:hypothetical protein
MRHNFFHLGKHTSWRLADMKLNIKNAIKGYLAATWNIGFVDSSLTDVLKSDHLNIIWLKHKFKDRWFADPFILSVINNEIVLLVEEFYIPKNKGRIARLIVNKKNFHLKRHDVILELETHVSFPAIFRDNNKVYIYPENGKSGSLTLFEYDEYSNSTSPHLIPIGDFVLSNNPLTDAIITKLFNNQPYMFATQLPYEKSIGNVLEIYKSKKWNGRYEFDHFIEFKENIARNAGDLFEIEGKIIRPAQICNNGYGKGIILQEIQYENGKFSFIEMKRFYPSSPIYNMGLHTFNSSGDKNIIIVDGYKIPANKKILRVLIPILSRLLRWRKI